MNKFFLYLILLIFLSNCGLVKKDVIEDDPNTKTLFEKPKPIEQELNPTLNIQLSKITNGEPFIGNDTNNSGNINYSTDFEKAFSYKFSGIDQFDFSQPELLFTDTNNIIFFNGKGEIFKLSKDFEEFWSINHYSKKEKKLKPVLYFAQSGNDIIILDTLSKVYSIKLSTGEINWSKESQSGFNSNIKVTKNRVVGVDFDNVIRAFY